MPVIRESISHILGPLYLLNLVTILFKCKFLAGFIEPVLLLIIVIFMKTPRRVEQQPTVFIILDLFLFTYYLYFLLGS